MELSKLHKDILWECADDDTGLWVIIRSISEEDYFADVLPEWVRQKTLQIIKDLLEEDLIEAGNFRENIYSTMCLQVNEIIAFIEREWDALGHTPSGGDVCWFRATPKGERLSHDLEIES